MKIRGAILSFSICYLFSFQCFAQNRKISTIAGIDSNGFSGDNAQATSAKLYWPYGINTDTTGNIFIADTYNNRIRKVDASTGIITTVAGGGPGPGYGDGGQATAASLYYPTGVIFDKSGNMYIADAGYNAIRKITAGTSIINTVAGSIGHNNNGYSGDGGLATAALLDGPASIAFDKNENLYIADENNNVIRKVTKLTGIITTFAGNGYGYWRPMSHFGGYCGDGGLATSAEMYDPSGISIDDSNNVYIADWLNNVVRMVSPTGVIYTVAGNHSLGGGYSGDGGQATGARLGLPINIALDDSSNLYIASQGTNVIRKVNKMSGIISTIAGNYTYGAGYSGNGGIATNAELNSPEGVAIDKWGNVYISDDLNSVVRKVTYNSTGIDEIQQSSEILVYPNPTNGNIIFQFKKPMQGNIEIYDISGKLVLNARFTQSLLNVDCSKFSNGTYFYKVLNDNGNLIKSDKIVVIH